MTVKKVIALAFVPLLAAVAIPGGMFYFLFIYVPQATLRWLNPIL